MKSTERFKNVIQKYLDNLATTNAQFTELFKKPNKNIDDCITYILNKVKASGCNGFAPNEIYGMAVHYYDEDTIVVGNKIECEVVINEPIVLTDEEKAQIKQRAIDELVAEEKKRLTKKPVPSTPVQKETPIIPINQGELF